MLSHTMAALREANADAEAREHAFQRSYISAVRQQREEARVEQLRRRLVDAFGAEAVETISRRVDPTFTMPPHLRATSTKEG